MSLLDKVLTGGGVVLIGVLARSAYRDARENYQIAQETKRRKSSTLRFDEVVTEREFRETARDVAMRTPRVEDVTVTGMTVILRVGSISGLSTWAAEIDFNDYGHLTGAYWVRTDNDDSLIPHHFANAMQAQIKSRVSRTVSEP